MLYEGEHGFDPLAPVSLPLKAASRGPFDGDNKVARGIESFPAIPEFSDRPPGGGLGVGGTYVEGVKPRSARSVGLPGRVAHIGDRVEHGDDLVRVGALGALGAQGRDGLLD